MPPKDRRRKAPALSKTNPTKSVALSDPMLGLPVMQREVRVRLNRLDLDGPWCLSNISKQDHLQLLKFVKQLETMRVSEVFNGSLGKDEDVASSSPNPEARRRAEETYRDDAEVIARVSLGNMKRLWGLRYDHEFHLIWWDPNHEVWPSQ